MRARHDGAADDVSESAADEDPFGLRLFVDTGTSYTVDDLVSVGYKKSRLIECEVLPNAQDAWYGFFNQKDIEVWVYESH